jgi:NAD-dependent DNA ligase (contains BRCT domain type II)
MSIFKRKKVVFTGKLDTMQRKEASEFVELVGGEIGNNLTQDTDFLVVGGYTQTQLDDRIVTKKLETAYNLIQRGFPLTLISESTFLTYLGEVHEEIKSFDFNKALAGFDTRMDEVHEIIQNMTPGHPFSDWPKETHLMHGQPERMERAVLRAYYRTDSTSCTCPDFKERKLPCKHIYGHAIYTKQLTTTMLNCTECEDEWLDENDTCPLCHKKFYYYSHSPLYYEERQHTDRRIMRFYKMSEKAEFALFKILQGHHDALCPVEWNMNLTPNELSEQISDLVERKLIVWDETKNKYLPHDLDQQDIEVLLYSFSRHTK